MAQRYIRTPILSKEDGTQYITNPIYPLVPENPDDIYLITTEGDRYDLLAQSFYGDINLWWVIAVANTATMDNLAIDPGLQIRIPTDIVSIVDNYNSLNR